jgi:sulfatase maturation enzyme AslB (radical SAM superfamily)
MARQIKTLQLDVTTVCQATCPGCARETDSTFNKSVKHHLTVDRILRSFPEKQIKKLDKMYMCGNYGEPAAGTYTQDILRYFREVNPDITLGMNTNGGVQTTFWWHSLGTILNKPTDYCVFSIDGLEDSNHVYRKNVNWAKLMANAQAYIAAGGNAQWDMLVYKHNQHQVEACEQLARDMGFTWFRAKVSKRPYTNGLEFPIGWQEIPMKPGKIKCYALEHKVVYMDAYGNISPCCWLGITHTPNAKVQDFNEIKATWKTDNPNPVCQEACTVNKVKTRFNSQWQREIQLK